MKRKPKRWFASDLHLNHKAMVEPNPTGDKERPFDSVEEMNDCILDNIHDCVKDGDKLYLLGDVVFQPATSEYLLKRLPLDVTLILGNHDELKASTRYYMDYFRKIVLWQHFEKQNFVCSHIPMIPDMFRGVMFNVHGHTHKYIMNDARYINICVENIGYRPVELDWITAEIESRLQTDRELRQ